MQKLGLTGLPHFINSNAIERIGVKLGFYDLCGFLSKYLKGNLAEVSSFLRKLY